MNAKQAYELYKENYSKQSNKVLEQIRDAASNGLESIAISGISVETIEKLEELEFDVEGLRQCYGLYIISW